MGVFGRKTRPHPLQSMQCDYEGEEGGGGEGEGEVGEEVREEVGEQCQAIL